MKTKDASIKTSAIALCGIIILGVIGAFAGSEGGGAAQGAFICLLAILPILLFTSVIFPAIAHLIKNDFSLKKWVILNSVTALTISLLISFAIIFLMGGTFTKGFTVTLLILSVGLVFPSNIWLWIANSK